MKKIFILVLFILSCYYNVFALNPVNSKYDKRLQALTKPGAVNSLTALGENTSNYDDGLFEGQIKLQWIAGDRWNDPAMTDTSYNYHYIDSNYTYLIRVATNTIDSETDWSSAIAVTNSLSVPDSGDTVTIVLPTSFPELELDSTYYFAVRVVFTGTIILENDSTLLYVADTSDLSSGSYTTTGIRPRQDHINPNSIDTLWGSFSTNTGQITLSWVGVGDDRTAGIADTYKIVWDTAQITNNSRYNTLLSTPNVYIDSSGTIRYGDTVSITLDGDNGLIEGKTYYFAIKAFDNAGNASDSIAVSDAISFLCTSGNCNPPSAIRDLAAHGVGDTTFLNIPESTVVLTWSAPYDDNDTSKPVASYIIKYSFSPIVTETDWNNATLISNNIVPKSPFQPETLFVSNLILDSLYYFCIVSVDSFNNRSGLSNIEGAYTKPQIDIISPSFVDSFFVNTGAGEGTIQLIWMYPGDDTTAGAIDSVVFAYANSEFDSSSFENQRKVYYSSSNIKSAGIYDTLEVNNLKPGDIYYFMAKFFDNVGNYSYSILDSAVAGDSDIIAPSPITDLVVSNYNSTPYTVSLVFTATGDDYYKGRADHYEIRFSTTQITSSNFDSCNTMEYNGIPAYPGELDTIILDDTRLAGGKIYFFAVKVIDESGNKSEISNIDTVAMPIINDLLPPSKITDLVATKGASKGEVILQWTAPSDNSSDPDAVSGVKGYIIKYSNEPITNDSLFNIANEYYQNWSPLSAGGTETHSIFLPDSTAAYYLAIKSYDYNYNYSSFSNVVYVKLSYGPHFYIKANNSDIGLVSVNDTIALDIYFDPSGYRTTGVSFYATINDTFFQPVDMDSTKVGVQPFISSQYFGSKGIVIENNIYGDSIGGDINGLQGYQFNFTEILDSVAKLGGGYRNTTGKIAVLYLKAIKADSANKLLDIEFNYNNGRFSTAIDQNGNEISCYGEDFYIKPYGYTAMIYTPLQGRSEYSGLYRITVLDSARNMLSSLYYPLNEPLYYNADKTGVVKVPYLPQGTSIVYIKEPRYLTGEDSIVIDTTVVFDTIVYRSILKNSTYNHLRGGDANDDNFVNLIDLGMLAYYFNESVPSYETVGGVHWSVDFNNDGFINLSDFSILASNFGERGSIISSSALAKLYDMINDSTISIEIENNNGKYSIIADVNNIRGYNLVFASDKFNISKGDYFQSASVFEIKKELSSNFSYSVALQSKYSGEFGSTLCISTDEKIKTLKYIEFLDNNFKLFRVYYNSTEIEENSNPKKLTLVYNYPNPFNTVTKFVFNNVEHGLYDFKIYNIFGEEIFRKKIIINNSKYEFLWPLKKNVSSGIYFYKFYNDKFSKTGKLILLK